MKIALLIHSLSSKSGSERVCINLANAFVSKHDVTLICNEKDHQFLAYPIDKKVKIKFFDGNFIKFLLKVKKDMLLEKYELCIINNMGKLSFLCSWLPNSIKRVSLEHVAFQTRSMWLRFLSPFFYSNYQKIIVLTKEDQKFYKFHNDVVVIPNFSSYSLNNFYNRNNKNIIAVGRLTEQKNFIHLLKAWKELELAHLTNSWTLNLYGEGNQYNMLHAYIIRYNLHNIKLNKPVVDIENIYQSASFLVMSSKYEGQPMVLLEAITHAIPIVSYNCPYGPSSIIDDGKNGFLVEDQNYKKLASTIKILIQDINLRTKMSDNALHTAKFYQKDTVLDMWNKLIFQEI